MEKYGERRTHERYDIALPCLLSLNKEGEYSNLMELKTRNISAAGVFLELEQINGFIVSSAKVEIIIPPNLIKCIEGSGTHISVSGSVVRASADGIAVLFCEEYQIAPLDEVLRFVKKKIDWMERQRCWCGGNEQSNLLRFSLKRAAHNHEKWKMEKV